MNRLGKVLFVHVEEATSNDSLCKEKASVFMPNSLFYFSWCRFIR
ncbi:hypothetical protein YM392_1685 [Enterococcus faecalis]|nr:hypothetical protein YM392_1685 [Enterococcus faecalis]